MPLELYMTSLRPEIVAFVRAAQTLIAMKLLTLSFTEEEEGMIGDYLIKLDEHFSSQEQ